MIDLNMRDGDGFSVLEDFKSEPEWAVIPTLVFSSSSDPEDIERSYLLGAASYIVKPTESEELKRLLRVFHDYWSECEVPEIDSSGRWLDTESKGKLGARFT